MADRPQLTAEPIETGPGFGDELDPKRLRRRALQVIAVLAAVGLVAWLAPGLDEVRDRLAGAEPGWLLLAVALEVLSCWSYVLMFRPVFCPRMSWRTSYEIAMSEVAVGSLVPASGAGGLALGAWALRRGGMPAKQIAERSVAFFLLKSAANFVAVAVLGTLMWVGLGPDLSPALTLLPAALAVATIALAVALGRIRVAPTPRPESSRVRQIARAVAAAVGDGARVAGRIVRSRNLMVLGGSLGYWAFDNAVLWACFRAFGEAPHLTIVLMAYLIGQLGGLLPLPGGLGGIDGGLVGALVVYGTPLTSAAAAVLAYRLVLFWIPLLLGSTAFAALRRGLNDPERPDLCDPFGPPARLALD